MGVAHTIPLCFAGGNSWIVSHSALGLILLLRSDREDPGLLFVLYIELCVFSSSRASSGPPALFRFLRGPSGKSRGPQLLPEFSAPSPTFRILGHNHNAHFPPDRRWGMEAS